MAGSVWKVSASEVRHIIRIAILTLASSVLASGSSILTIIPTFDSTITNDPHAAAIEDTINSAIAYYEATFVTNTPNSIDVSILFQEMTTGLGSSSLVFYDVPYQSYINALADSSSGDATDTTALAHVPTGATEPVTGGTEVFVKTALLRALGFSAATYPNGGFDSTISLNVGLTFPPRSANSSTFSLFSVVSHEIDEVLGLGSALPVFSFPFPEDLFRYDASGNRSYNSSFTVHSFFSLDGTTDLAQFSNVGRGEDFGDWQSDPRPAGVAPKVQDATGIQALDLVLTDSSPEVIALDAVGYNLADSTAVTPEPACICLVGLGLIAMSVRMLHRGLYRF